MYAGGLLGKCGTAFYASESSNKADITSVQAAGGLLGVTYEIKLTNVYNAGSVSGNK